MITFEEADRLLKYDPETGILYWKEDRSSSIKKGSAANTLSENGYIRICVNGKRYLGHRLAWLLFYKEHPGSSIDHINNIRSDNRIENLRVVSISMNNFNRTMQKNNTSGYRGVTFDKSRKLWMSQIHKNGMYIYLGRYQSKEIAAEVYKAKMLELYSDSNDNTKSVPRVKKDISLEELRSLLKYDANTGQLIWLKNRGTKTCIGKVAGCVSSGGYLKIYVYGKAYAVHRLVWFMHKGYFPTKIIDHIDRNRRNNRIENLREVTRSENAKNVGVTKANTSGVKGVRFNKASNAWFATIRKDNKKIHLGSFKNIDDAKKAYEDACKKLFPTIYVAYDETEECVNE